MGETLAVGSRIKISANYHFAENVTGEITQPPAFIIENSDGWKEIVREVKYSKGILFFYWVKFDEPQIDEDGDGPYQEAEIDSEHLILLNSNN